MRPKAGAILGLAAIILALGSAADAAAPRATVLHVSSHLEKNARISLDGGRAATAPGYGSTSLATVSGHHVLKVTTAAGVTYSADLDLKAADLMSWHGRGYWCVNLLERSLETYSKDECQEDVTDAG